MFIFVLVFYPNLELVLKVIMHKISVTVLLCVECDNKMEPAQPSSGQGQDQEHDCNFDCKHVVFALGKVLHLVQSALDKCNESWYITALSSEVLIDRLCWSLTWSSNQNLVNMSSQ